MRILHISSQRIFGGGERHLADLCRGLHKRGHEVFVALRPTNEWQGRLDFLQAEKIFHVSIRNSFGVLSAIKIADFVRENNIEIVHAHAARDYIPASIACLIAQKAKFVITRHVLFPLKPFNRFALKNLSYAIGVSDAVGDALRAVFPPAKVVVIPNGIDFRNYACGSMESSRNGFREFHGIAADVPLVGTLGELKEIKGQRDFVLAAREISKALPDCHFVIVGKDNLRDKSFRRELKRLVRVFEMEDRFLWLDWLDDTAPFYFAIDLFVSPSHSESFGLAILEAIANETPVVATRTEGALQLLGDSGRFAPINDPVALAAAITESLSENLKCSAAAAAARKRAEQLFNLDTMIQKTECLYEAMLGIRRKAGIG